MARTSDRLDAHAVRGAEQRFGAFWDGHRGSLVDDEGLGFTSPRRGWGGKHEADEGEDSDGLYEHVSDDNDATSNSKNFENLNLAMINMALLRSALIKGSRH